MALTLFTLYAALAHASKWFSFRKINQPEETKLQMCECVFHFLLIHARQIAKMKYITFEINRQRQKAKLDEEVQKREKFIVVNDSIR